MEVMAHPMESIFPEVLENESRSLRHDFMNYTESRELIKKTSYRWRQ